jgi:dihydropteroate synthase
MRGVGSNERTRPGLARARRARIAGVTLGDRAARFMNEIARARTRGEAVVMGVCNVTPDSFSDGGAYLAPTDARQRVDTLLAEGAIVIDVGGESTRPGAPRVSPAEQIARIAGVVAYAKDKCVVSVDTTSAEVAEHVLALGAHVINDVSLLSEPALAAVVASFGAALVLSHARGFQKDMAGFGSWPEADYDDIVRDVLADYTRKRDEAVSLGVARDAFVMDPGLGFSKSARHSLELLRRTSDLVAHAGAPVLIGASRKSFLTHAIGDAPPNERLGASIAAAVYAQSQGAAVVRVHDVRETRQALALSARLADTSRIASTASLPSEPDLAPRAEAREGVRC